MSLLILDPVFYMIGKIDMHLISLNFTWFSIKTVLLTPCMVKFATSYQLLGTTYRELLGEIKFVSGDKPAPINYNISLNVCGFCLLQIACNLQQAMNNSEQ